MAYTEDPNNLLPGQEDPSFMDRMSKGVKMDFPNASVAGAGNSVKDAIMMNPHVRAAQSFGNMMTARDSRQPYPMPPSDQRPSNPYQVPTTKNPSDVLPATIPSPPPRDYLGEVNAMDKGTFNAMRDTPQPTAAQKAYSPPSPPQASTQTNPWESKGPAVADPGLLYGELVKRGQATGDMTVANEYQKTLVSQIHSMLPGASPKEVRSIMTTINQAVRNPNPMSQAQPGQAAPDGEPGSLKQAISKSQQPAPNYQKLGAGQSMYQMLPDGTPKHLITAPGGAAEQHKGDQFKQQQNSSMGDWGRIKREYDKSWDQITKDITDPAEKEQALRKHNLNHFQALGVPDELAEVPVSFKSYLQDITKGVKISRQQTEQIAADHRQKVQVRNKILESRFGNTLTFQ